MTDACPPDSELQRLLANQLSAAEEAGLETHVARCARCQALLEQLTRRVMPIPDFRPESASDGPVPESNAPLSSDQEATLLGPAPEPGAHFYPAQVRLLLQHVPRQSDSVARESPPSGEPKRSPIRHSRWPGSVTLRAAGDFFLAQVWVWPLVLALLLGAAGWWVHRSVDNAMRQQRINELTTVLEADIAALRAWMDNQRVMSELLASDDRLRPPVQELLAVSPGGPQSDRRLLDAKAQAELRSRLAAPLRKGGFAGFVIVSPSGVILAADADASVGRTLVGYHKEFMARVARGEAAVSRPFLSQQPLPDAVGALQANLPTMAAAAPVLDEAGKPLAVLGLRIRPEREFTRILQVARSGESGETYAFDRDGRFLSQSRFDDDLKQIGLLTDQPGSASLLTLEVRDPGVNMVEGERPRVRRPDQPLTRMAADAVQGRSGHDTEGYRDYRGVPVVGAWRWLDDYDFGVATEMDLDEALAPLYILRRAFWVLMGLLILAAAAIFVSMLLLARQRRALRKAAFVARQLGQYTLIELLGTGGMGTVYKARHAMLRRPTAVKLLNVDQMSERAIARFEREVQLTAGLTHPNTVAIFDYGCTPEGVFYYVMEYLDGITLADLVTRGGPVPEARVLFILRQVCASLAEAHAAGLVHRDVKPENIFLTCRGGLHDFVKVLDFGLVKLLDSRPNASLTSSRTVAGTPLYLSPEAVSHPDQVDARADVYGIAAVGYFLLTGSPVFPGDSAMEICLKHVQDVPQSPSIRSGQRFSPELEALLLRCLAKSRSERPADAAELLRLLEACTLPRRWTEADAASWWAVHGPQAPLSRRSPIADSDDKEPTVLANAPVASKGA